MKKNTSILLIVSVVILSAGCQKFLDKEPDNRAKLTSPQSVSELLASAYPQANYEAMAELSSDNVGDNINNDLDQASWSKLVNDYYLYQDNNGTDEDGPEYYWFGCYKAIAASNLALQAIDEAPDPQNYRAQKGEALLTRAYSHFMLVNFFSKFYNASTASSDLGIPYVTQPETISIKQYDRKTVQFVYDMIEKDLQQGLPLIDNSAYPQTDAIKYHFTKSAASAFAARFYLYKLNYDSVIKYAQAALPENAYGLNLRQWNSYYNTLPANGSNSISAVYSKATEKANLLLVQTKCWWSRLIGGGKYGLTQDLGGYFTGSAPVSGGAWSFPLYSLGTGSHKHSLIPKINEFFVETSIGSGIGDGWQMVPLFTAEEVLFNLAEAYTYKGQTASAISLLNTYLSTRITDYDATNDNIDEDKLINYYTLPTDSLTQLRNGIISIFDLEGKPTSIAAYYSLDDVQKAVINTLLEYRRAEFVHEGMRWFDILRYGFQITHPYDQINEIALTPNNPHRVFQIPATAASQAGLQLNPR
ncbi:RagB/SusD family nutrient uptake outer membrane protein [Ferruginibacter albus]|uniref:RagB/SusD family nutrient uptake outer membrane protein n=1 Tax=Ferruginibacter albus TaxID=2875540 RepID=UPI001CC733B4|nr:RagB/SusD family nutrient uptake outer membrane protein [Ferruginibacter albus]UAY50781.1 RagB/SusD family nutrient uptake outer membrane protein [Ferruginibacter albus]